MKYTSRPILFNTLKVKHKEKILKMIREKCFKYSKKKKSNLKNSWFLIKSHGDLKEMAHFSNTER